MSTTPTRGSPIPDLGSLFSIGEGVFGRNLRKLQLAEGDRLRRVRVALLLTSVAWLPLLMLAVLEGVAWGSAVVPFVPLVFLVVPATEVVKMLAGLIV